MSLLSSIYWYQFMNLLPRLCINSWCLLKLLKFQWPMLSSSWSPFKIWPIIEVESDLDTQKMLIRLLLLAQMQQLMVPLTLTLVLTGAGFVRLSLNFPNIKETDSLSIDCIPGFNAPCSSSIDPFAKLSRSNQILNFLAKSSCTRVRNVLCASMLAPEFSAHIVMVSLSCCVERMLLLARAPRRFFVWLLVSAFISTSQNK